MFGFASVKMFLVTAALGVIAAGGSFLYGVSWGRAMERADAIAAAEWVRNTDSDFKAEAAAKEKASAEKLGKQESENDAVEDVLSRPEAGDDGACLSADWLRGLSKIR